MQVQAVFGADVAEPPRHPGADEPRMDAYGDEGGNEPQGERGHGGACITQEAVSDGLNGEHCAHASIIGCLNAGQPDFVCRHPRLPSRRSLALATDVARRSAIAAVVCSMANKQYGSRYRGATDPPVPRGRDSHYAFSRSLSGRASRASPWHCCSWRTSQPCRRRPRSPSRQARSEPGVGGAHRPGRRGFSPDGHGTRSRTGLLRPC